MPDLLETFTRLAGAVAAIVDTEPDPLAQTPCADWNYAQLLGHLVGGDRLFARILTGRSGPPRAPRMAPEADAPPPSSEDYRQASGRIAELLSDESIRSGVHQAPVGPLRGDGVIVLRSTEHFLHGWDLAMSAGVPTDGLEPLAGALSGPARNLLELVGEQTLAARRPFGAAVTVPADASELAQLVAAFGRDPRWVADPVEGYARLVEHFADYPDVELPDGSRRGYGANGLRVDGSIFATPHGGRLMLKLPEPDVRRLIEDRVGAPLSKPGQRPMREWVLLPFDGAATRRAEAAYAFVRGAV